MALATTAPSIPPALGGTCASPDSPFRAVAADDSAAAAASSARLVFVYGTLKRGFGNDWLMRELVSGQHACFVSEAITRHQFPLVCGPFQVPFLLNFPSQGHRVRGEAYLVDQVGLRRLDELEGVGRGYYERKPVLVDGLEQQQQQQQSDQLESSGRSWSAEAYFADSSYAFRMLGAPHLPSYSSVQAAAYVPRKNRPPGTTLLQNVQAWIAADYGQTKRTEIPGQ